MWFDPLNLRICSLRIYSHNQYQSKDLDFVTASILTKTWTGMEKLGFGNSGTNSLFSKIWRHPPYFFCR